MVYYVSEFKITEKDDDRNTNLPNPPALYFGENNTGEGQNVEEEDDSARNMEEAQVMMEAKESKDLELKDEGLRVSVEVGAGLR